MCTQLNRLTFTLALTIRSLLTDYTNKTSKHFTANYPPKQARNNDIMNNVTKNTERQLFVIQSGNGYSCYGFDNCDAIVKALVAELDLTDYRIARKGSLKQYRQYRELSDLVKAKYNTSRFRSSVNLTPQLVGLEGRRVEVVTTYGETRRFNVGKSTGWIPCHLEVYNSRSSGGGSAEKQYQSVRIIR